MCDTDNASADDSVVLLQLHKNMRNGCKTALVEFMKLTSAQIMQFCLSLVGPNDAEGMVNFVYSQMLRSDCTSNVLAYMKAIARNERIRLLKKNCKLSSLDNETCDPIDQLPMPDDAAETKEVRLIVSEAIKVLSPVQRDVVILHYYQGLSCAEIADRLKSKIPTVKSQLQNARKNLKPIIQQKLDIARDE